MSSAPRPAQGGSADRGPGIVLPPPLYYVAGLCIGLLASRQVPTPLLPEPVAITLALLLFGGAVGLGFSAMGLFRRAHTGIMPHHPASALVTSGPYRVTRNPMYTGLALVYLGIAILLQSLWSILLLPFVLWVVTVRVIRREEPYLERKFGADYRTYKKRVRRWL